MAVKVHSQGEWVMHEEGEEIVVKEAHLYVQRYDARGDFQNVAIYSPGIWQRSELVLNTAQ